LPVFIEATVIVFPVAAAGLAAAAGAIVGTAVGATDGVAVSFTAGWDALFASPQAAKDANNTTNRQRTM
jgi:hypothetical protein